MSVCALFYSTAVKADPESCDVCGDCSTPVLSRKEKSICGNYVRYNKCKSIKWIEKMFNN